MTKSIVNNLFI